MQNNDIITIACLVGMLGDSLLQILVKEEVGDWGLKKYFEKHGSAESICIAGGMMTLFYIIYLELKIPLKYEYLALYGIVLDFLFRKSGIFPSLDDYYNSLNYLQSAIWGAIPMMLPLLVFQKIKYHNN